MFITDIHSLGLPVTQGMYVTSGWYWDLNDETRAWKLFARRADKEYSFTDCVSFEIMRRLGITRAAALDDDFRREGFTVLP